MSTYLFGDGASLKKRQHAALEALLDGITTKRLASIGVTEGWKCLEVGAGNGSVARWLSERVGAAGHVTATDLDTSWIGGLAADNLWVMRHDVVNEPLPDSGYDLIHARLVLVHIPERLTVLDTLVAALRPGGYLLLEEFDATHMSVLRAPSREDERIGNLFHATLTTMLSRAGARRDWGPHIREALTQHGLTDVESTTEKPPWAGGSPGCALLCAVSAIVRQQAIDAGLMTASDLARFAVLCEDPEFEYHPYWVISAWGRKP